MVNLLDFFVAKTLIFESGRAGEDDRLEVNSKLRVLLRGHRKFGEVFRDFDISDSRSRSSSHFCGCSWVFAFCFCLRKSCEVMVVEGWKKLWVSVRMVLERWERGWYLNLGR